MMWPDKWGFPSIMIYCLPLSFLALSSLAASSFFSSLAFGFSSLPGNDNMIGRLLPVSSLIWRKNKCVKLTLESQVIFPKYLYQKPLHKIHNYCSHCRVTTNDLRLYTRIFPWLFQILLSNSRPQLFGRSDILWTQNRFKPVPGFQTWWSQSSWILLKFGGIPTSLLI